MNCAWICYRATCVSCRARSSVRDSTRTGWRRATYRYMPFIRYAVFQSIFKISLSANPCFGSSLVSMRIGIQLFTSIRVRIQGAKPMRIRILVRLFFLENFLRARVCRPLLCLCRPFMIFEGCLDSNPEYCRSKLARNRLSHPPIPLCCHKKMEFDMKNTVHFM